jgi:hypothetical protein
MRRLASSNSDAFYLFTTPVFTFVSVFNTFILNKENDTKLRFIKFISIVYIILSILFLIVLSMIYDFGTCLYPSRERPFFASGRLILGVLVPFLILYVDGLNVILEKISKRFNLFFVVFLMSIFISHYETVSLMIVIKSKYNWFHL